jgi:hypothetical protein
VTSEWSPDIPQEIRGQLPPFGVKPHWVSLNFSSKASHLYDLYNCHVSADRADRIVWPTLEDLAEMMGYSRGDKVTPFMRELEAGGAIEVRPVTKTGGQGLRYIVTVKLHPPVGFEGPMQSSDWHDRKKATETKKTNLSEEARKGSKQTKKTNTAPGEGKTAGQEVHPQTGGDVHPQTGGDVPPETGVVRKNQVNQNHLKKDAGVADAAGKGAGGFARERAHEAEREGGSAASGKKRKSPGVKTLKTRPPKLPAGFAEVRDAIPQEIARPGTQLWPGLRRAICNRLDGSEGVAPRTAPQIIARINRAWFSERGPERAAPDYRGCPRCTPTGCQASRDECDRIKSPSAWLAKVILAKDCEVPECEAGIVLSTGEDCRTCDRRAIDRQAQLAKAKLVTDTAALAEMRQRAAEQESPPEPANPDAYPAPDRKVTWHCEECSRIGRGSPPYHRLCPDCLPQPAPF